MGKHVLAFLSMKRFHPARQDNQYKLFKAESDHKNLLKTQKEYQKIYEEEQRELLKQQREADLKHKLISQEAARKKTITDIHSQKKKTRRGKRKNRKVDELKEQLEAAQAKIKELESQKSSKPTDGGVLDGSSLEDMVQAQRIAESTNVVGDRSQEKVDLGKTANVKQSVNFLYLVPPGYKESLTRQALEDEKRDQHLEKVNAREQDERDQMHMLELQREAMKRGLPFNKVLKNDDDMNDDDDLEDEYDGVCERCHQKGHAEGDPSCPLNKFDPLLNRQIIAQNPYEPIEYREKAIRDVGLNIQPLDSTGGSLSQKELDEMMDDLDIDDMEEEELLLHFNASEIALLKDWDTVYAPKLKKLKKAQKKAKKKKEKKKKRYSESDDPIFFKHIEGVTEAKPNPFSSSTTLKNTVKSPKPQIKDAALPPEHSHSMHSSPSQHRSGYRHSPPQVTHSRSPPHHFTTHPSPPPHYNRFRPSPPRASSPGYNRRRSSPPRHSPPYSSRQFPSSRSPPPPQQYNRSPPRRHYRRSPPRRSPPRRRHY